MPTPSEGGTAQETREFLSGGGEMSERIRVFDWARTPLGPLGQWPQSLKTSVSLIVNSRHPMWIGWGPEMTFLYNDAYVHVLSLAKHPWALGRPAPEVWAEIWDVCGPMAAKVFARGEATFVNDVRLFMSRGDFLEETFYSFSYSPIRDESGNVGGLFCPSEQTTDKVLNARRLRTLSELAANALVERSVEAACAAAAGTVAANPDDIPFALVYLIDAQQQRALLAQTAGLSDPSGLACCPGLISLSDVPPGRQTWPIVETFNTSRPRVISVRGMEGLPAGPAGQRVSEAMILPVASPGEERPVAILVAGINPTRKLDAEYRTFYELVAGQVARAIQNARAAEEQKRRADALAELDRAKTLFFSNVSHEFRTPLTLMLGPLEETLAGANGRLPPEDREQLTRVHRNGLRLLKLVNTLLDFSRVEAGRAQAVYEPVDLTAYTAELASVFRSAVEKAGLRLVVNCPPLSEPVYVDREMWEKIVLNLLSNALKFTLEGEIEVSLEEENGRVELSVRDTGTGIPAKELAHVFERFHRVKGARGRTHEGTGIGLSLVQELIKQHGGTVTVESMYGQGTTFIVSLPKGSAHLPQERVGHARTHAPVSGGATPFIEEALRWLPADDDRIEGGASDVAPDAQRAGESPQGRVTGMARVLLADDNADMRDYVKRLLERSYEVEAVADGRAALEAARARTPDLVLTDVMMPQLDGFGLLRELRDDPGTRAVPVIMLSARAGEESRVEGLEAGADDYLVKPFSARELLARVRANLEMARLRREFTRELEAAHARNEEILASISDAFFFYDRDWRYVYLNDKAVEMARHPREELLGKSVWEVFPDTVGSDLDLAFRRAAEGGVPTTYIHYYPPFACWFENRIYPSPEGFTVLVSDVTERRRAEEERERLLAREQALREQAEAASRLKDEFLATVSHELRTPLTAILGWTHILRAGQLDAEGAARALETVERNARSQNQLIEDLLDVSRAITGKLRLDIRPCDPISFIEAAVEAVRPAAEAKGVRLLKTLDAGASPVSGDAERLQQVVWNLLSNAIKFTPRGGRVQVRLERVNSHVEIVVADTGAGIPADFLPYVFDRFRQADGSTTRMHGGLGLGLAIVRHLVDMHGGSVNADSGGAGLGATFTVKLPVIPVYSREETGERARPPARDNTPPPIEYPDRLDGLRVLVVDDEVDACEMLRVLLTSSGAEVVTATSVGGALAELGRARFDLLVSDIGMPGADGYELMTRVRGLPAEHGGRIPAVALTAYARAEDRLRALRSGYQMHVAKPVEAVELIAVLASLAGRT